MFRNESTPFMENKNISLLIDYMYINSKWCIIAQNKFKSTSLDASLKITIEKVFKNLIIRLNNKS
jgi:hypothetical protein